MSDSSAEQQLLNDLAEEFADRQRRGERPSLGEYTDRYPHLAEQIRDLFPALAMMEQVRPATADATGAYDGPPGAEGARLERLGDYRILREVGRGGMGIVYEAEQISLGRHVALKVLPAAALLDQKHLRRFEREAKAAARLHHTNIVPVYGVGEDGGLHYYVMQFIPGLALDEVLAELRRLRHRGEAPPANGRTADASAAAQALLTGTFSNGSQVRSASEGKPEPSSDSSVHLPGQADGSSLTDTGRAYWHGVARIGIQVAEALAYAGSQGILHRDIKPANLLLDGQGTVWVTDFGLARAAADTDALTHTGDVVGTLRYMAPERFRGAGDARSDIYALGLTLYELLTLQPAFPEADRHRLVEEVMHAEPVAPRRLNRAVPRDLETIVLKAIDRDPARRYPTATALADDLRRFLEDRPIRARRVGARERLWRWCRRNPVVAALTAALVLAFLLGFTGVAWKWQEAERQKDIAQEAGRREAAQRAVAEAQADRATREVDRSRHLLYASDMGLAQQAWEAGDTGRARDLLERQWPQAGQEDLRGFEWRYLWGLCQDGSRHTLRGHTGEVSTLAFSPDGTTLAACDDGGVRLWDMASRRHVKLLAWRARSPRFAPDGKTLAIIEAARTVRLWDRAERRERAMFFQGTDANAVDFSPDGKLLAMACGDTTVRLWDVATRREVGVLRGHTQFVRCVAFSPDGKTLASAGMDTTVRLWDVAGRRSLATFEDHTSAIFSVAFSPDGKTVASASIDTTVRLWDTTTRRGLKTLRGQRTGIGAVAFSPDGKALAAGGGDGTIRVWDTATNEVATFLRGHTAPVTALAYAPDGQSLASGGQDGTVKIWDVVARRDPNVLPGNSTGFNSLAFSPDGKTLAVGDRRDEAVKLWDVASRRQFATLKGDKGPPWSVAFSPSGQTVASFSTNSRTLRLWDVATRRRAGEFQVGNGGWGSSLAFSPHGTFLAVGVRGSETVVVWDRVNRRPFKELGPGSQVQFSPDGTLLAAGSGDTVRLWDVASFQKVADLSSPKASIHSLAFAPDGRTLAVGDWDGTLRLWDVLQKRQVASRRGHSGLCSVAFSPGGRRLATCGGDGTLKFWDVAPLQEVVAFAGHEAPIGSLAFSPDGNTLATGAQDATVRLWQAPPLPPTPHEPAEDTSAPPPDDIIRLLSLELFDTARATRTPEGNAQRVDVTAVDGIDWHARLVQVYDDLQEGATYTVRFRARADAPRSIGLYGQNGGPDWHDIGLNQQVPLTRDWQPYQYEFRAKGLTAVNTIHLILGQQTGTVWVAHFTVTKGAK
jgi:WD40 repeat protein/serine/threonine protein kinase